MDVIGITGTLGAGKGTIVDFLVNEMGYEHFSVRSYLIEEINRRGLEVNRDSMTMVANDLRKNNSPFYIIEELYKLAVKSGKDSIIESIRTPGEVEYLKKQGNFILIAIDAAPEIRYERIVKRASDTDNVSFETFLANEKREFTTTDPNKQNLSTCIEKADIKVNNDGSVKEMTETLSEKLKNYLSK
jgi:dephospho-CoA kinase